MIKVLMVPHASEVKGTFGIDRVVEAYSQYLPEFGIGLVGPKATSYDLLAVHAGSGSFESADHLVSHLHGLYWTADLENVPDWQLKANANVIRSIRLADEVTVPGAWVGEALQRDMHFAPHVIPHGIDWRRWTPQTHSGYVLWNKNRISNVCRVEPLEYLARVLPQQLFLSTFATDPTPNIKVTSTVSHSTMKGYIQHAQVYLSTTKETFGIGTLEAMASGVPVLGFAQGGNLDLIKHGINGYLAAVDDYDDLAVGLAYCLEHRDTLGANGREMAKAYSWSSVCERVAEVYGLAVADEPPTASIIIPTCDKESTLERTIKSALAQTYPLLESVVVVDDGSANESAVREICTRLAESDGRLSLMRWSNHGVAHARNYGIECAGSKYICCLDADDWIAPEYLSTVVPHLEADKSLGIAYTGLMAVYGSGDQRVNDFPGPCDYDEQVRGRNQVSTCCVFRREAWKRLGGYRQRYAPRGCGTEDAEFWLRIGAIGYGIRKVSDESLFYYSLGGATADPTYKEVNWTAWHPWTKDRQHPFASIATPKLYSHPVRQYDEPQVSIVIPVGPGHEDELVNALDSLEAQTFRQWEVIVVDDAGGNGLSIDDAYPYVRQVRTKGKCGAGYARNRGAEIARAPFLVFLDADDGLRPECLEHMLQAWNQHEHIIYTDYIGIATISPEHADKLRAENRLHLYDEGTQQAVIAHRSAEYDCELAQRQPEYTNDPNMPFYHWCLVTCLVPKSWHDEIGGFDESMSTWEDIDYHWRLARRGKCYHHLPEELVVYQFAKGHRREASKTGQTFQNVVQYIRSKYEEDTMTPCKGCGGKKPTSSRTMLATSGPFSSALARQTRATRAKDEEYILVQYTHPNRGKHPVIGSFTHQSYGYVQHGERILVHRDDVFDAMGRRIGRYFEPIREKAVAAEKVIQKKAAPPPPRRLDEKSTVAAVPVPVAMSDDMEIVVNVEPPLDLQTIPGITREIARQLEAKDIVTMEAILAMGSEGLQKIRGCGEIRSALILSALEKMIETKAEAEAEAEAEAD